MIKRLQLKIIRKRKYSWKRFYLCYKWRKGRDYSLFIYRPPRYEGPIFENIDLGYKSSSHIVRALHNEMWIYCLIHKKQHDGDKCPECESMNEIT